MSVIGFGKEEMLKTEGMLLHNFKRRNTSSVRSAVQFSNVYNRFLSHEIRCDKGYAESEKQEELQKDILGRFVWYAWVANKTAYALNYREEPGFFDDVETDGDTEPVHCSPKELLQNLQSLRYNLMTGDGNSFLSRDWDDLLNDIINNLNDHIVRDAERVERGHVI